MVHDALLNALLMHPTRQCH